MVTKLDFGRRRMIGASLGFLTANGFPFPVLGRQTNGAGLSYLSTGRTSDGRFVAVRMTASGDQNVAAVWDMPSNTYLGSVSAFDASGLSSGPSAGAFVVAGGDGTMKSLYTPALEVVNIATGSDIAAWDNHIEAVVLIGDD
jgi:hypothetical protein